MRDGRPGPDAPGQRSQYFGASARNNGSLAGSDTNLDSDTYFQAVRRSGTVDKVLAEPTPLGPTPQVRQLVDGYVAGFNRYLKDVGVAQLPDPTCRGKAWVGAITAEDVWTDMLDINRINGESGLRAQVAEAAPPAPAAAAASPAALGGALTAAPHTTPTRPHCSPPSSGSPTASPKPRSRLRPACGSAPCDAEPVAPGGGRCSAAPAA